MKPKNKQQEQYDVAVIGGGPAGMMAAIQASAQGAKVILLEKNTTLGKKLLITGKGRCNITQATDNNQLFVSKLGKKGKFLFSALAAFGPKNVIEFFEKNNLATKTERGGRVFPISNKATDVLAVLQNRLQQNKVTIKHAQQVLGFGNTDNTIEYIRLKDKKILAKTFIICTGGKTYPATGSTGDGYAWATSLGHSIQQTMPSLVPIKTKETWIKQLQGLSLKNVQINIFQDNKKIGHRFGEMLFTHTGLSGPIILDVSKTIGQLLPSGSVIIELDLKPALTFVQLDQRLQRDFAENKLKDFKNYLPELVPQKLIPTIISLSKISADKKVFAITKDERKTLVRLLKGIRFTAGSLMGFNHAIITSGGVNLKEIDSKTMRSKLVNNLFFAGEIIDLDGPTGGYNLQICWSTGFVAGSHAGANMFSA